MTTLLDDLRSGTRHLARRPLVTAFMIIVLALGIGAPAAIWGAVDRLWLHPLPFPEAERLVLLWETQAELSGYQVAAAPIAEIWRREIPELVGLAVSRPWRPVWNDAELRGLPGARVSAGFFSVLGVEPGLGRDFAPADDRPGAPPVVIVSHRLWQEELGGGPDVLGRRLELEGNGASLTATVIGVLPPLLAVKPPVVFEPAEVWMPLAIEPRDAELDERIYRAVGRLAPDASVEAVGARLAALAPRLAVDHPETHAGWSAAAERVTEVLLAPRRPALAAMWMGVCFLFAVAVSNVALLLLAQAVARQREAAVRLTVGALPRDVARQRFVESLLLAALSAAAGLALAYGIFRPGLMLGLDDWLRGRHWTLDAGTAAVTLVLALGAAALLAVLPVAGIVGRDLGALLRRDERAGPDGRHGRFWRGLFVVVPATLSFSLLVVTALLLQSFERLIEADPGFKSDDVLTVEVRIPPSIHPDDHQVPGLWRRLLDEVGTLPQVRSAALVNHLPMRGQSMSTEAAPAERRGAGEPVWLELRGVSPGYFRSLGIPLVAGRDHAAADLDVDGAGGLVLSVAAAERLWPGEEAVGRELVLEWGDREPREVVGVVADVRHDGLAESVKPAVYLPFPELRHRTMTLVVRASADPAALAPAVRSRIRELDRGLVIEAIRPLADVVAATVAARRGYTWILLGFAAVTLLLAAGGTYSVIAYSVARRRRDFGVRLALGARPASLSRSVVAEGLGYALAGVAVGVALALAASRLLSGLLYGVSAYDPVTFVGSTALVLAV
ncbi:MAG TPA: ADOP family duplicated permease, partial [Thermoanaerobaculia bacterium]